MSNDYARCDECKRQGASLGVLLCEKLDRLLRPTRRRLCGRCRKQLGWRAVDFTRTTNTSAPPDARAPARLV